MSKQDKLRAIRGMNDILPTDEALWTRLEEAVASTMLGYGYRRIRTPIVEQTGLFVRGIGAVTDIVEKEMYSFTDSLNGDALTLRPENTAGVVRASIEHSLTYDGPQRLWYNGPMFRHERPQKGRYRQFHQVGAEFLSVASPQADTELILLGQRLWDDLDLSGIKLHINSLGQLNERQAHREALIKHFEANEALLDEDARRRLHSNPLRILDTKNPAMRPIVDQAPLLIDFLGAESIDHFETVQALLKSQNIPFEIDPRLVRGLDYYNLTVFEWVAADGLTVCGGGRYDPLIEMLGGKASFGCGWALGVERVLDLMREQQAMTPFIAPEVFVAQFGDNTAIAAFQAAERLRDIGLDVALHCAGGSPKSQLKRADASGAAVALIIGEQEAADNAVMVKPLRSPGSEQQLVPIDELVEFITNLLLGTDDDDIEPVPPPTHH